MLWPLVLCCGVQISAAIDMIEILRVDFISYCVAESFSE